jgi:hypothetical protein
LARGRRLEELLDQGAPVAPARVDGRRYSDRQIERALALVAEGRCLREAGEAGEAVGAAQTTVLRWLARAA